MLVSFTRRLLLFSACNALVVNGALTLIAVGAVSAHWLPHQAAVTGVGATRDFLAFHQGDDSWGPMLEAVKLHDAGHPIYDTLFFSLSMKFQYPLTALLPLVAVRKIGISEDQILTLLNVASWLAIWVTIGFSTALVFAIRPRLERIAVTLAIGLAGLCFYPMMRAYLLGQIQVFLTMLFAMALYYWVRERPVPAGALIGLMTLVKPQYAVIVLWFLLRKRYPALWAALSVVTVGSAISLALFGWQEHVRYLDVLTFIAKRGESFYANLSVNGILNRLLFNGPNLEWDANSYAPYNPWIYALTTLSSILIAGGALLIYNKSHAVDLAAITITATLASPVAWDHHYGVLFPIFALLVARWGVEPGAVGLGVAYLLVSNSWSPMNLLSRVPILNLLQSMELFGVLLLLVLCYRSRKNLGFFTEEYEYAPPLTQPGPVEP
jgi:hypothetical protein